MAAELPSVRYRRADRGGLMRGPQLFTVDGTGVTQIADSDETADDVDAQLSTETAGTA